MSRKMSFVILALLVASCVITGCGKEEAVVTSETLSPAQEKAQTMDWAFESGETVFVYTKDESVAICYGGVKICTLSERERRVEVSSQEAMNLVLCKRNAETANYYTIQDISGVSPGDYLSWDSNGVLGWTRYVAQ